MSERITLSLKRTDKSKEDALRKKLKSSGYMLQKSRAYPDSIEYGTYRIVDMSTNIIVAGGWGAYKYGLSLDEVESWVNG